MGLQVSKSLYWSNNRSIFMQFIEEETGEYVKLLNNKRKIPKEVINSRKSWHGNYYFTTFEELNTFLNPTQEFETEYMLLDRLRSELVHYIDINQKQDSLLWAGNPKDQIAKMHELYDKLPEKPEWCTKEEIDILEKASLNVSNNWIDDVISVQSMYDKLMTEKCFTKKNLCNAVVWFRDKYKLNDLEALQIARKELSLAEIKSILSK